MDDILPVGFSSDHSKNYIIFGSHFGTGDNNVSKHSKAYNKDYILHCLFSLEKIVKMPESCCVKNCSILNKKYKENIKFYLLPKDKVRHKLYKKLYFW